MSSYQINADGIKYRCYWDKTHFRKERLGGKYQGSFSARKKSRKKRRAKNQKLTKGQKWWRSLTLVEQADWRYEKMLKEKGKANWYFEYEQCKKEGHYREE